LTSRPLSRRRLLLLAGGALAGGAGLGLDAFGWAPRRVQVSRHEVAIPGLPPVLAGLTIAHLSDIHLYQGIHPAAERAMELVSALQPDLTVITGDLVEQASLVGELPAFFRACRGRLATVVTMGNWEYQTRVLPADLARAAGSAGAALLINEAVRVTLGGQELALVGLDDPRAGLPDPEKALADLPSGIPTIWAFHAPGYADLLSRLRFPRPVLALAGHTHGGQIRPPLLPPITPPASGRFVAGWYRDTFAPFYVSRGIGTSGVRARLRCAPEVGLFTLRSA
jgi:predicted MPP superfamily phosphohydrolase